MWALLGRVSLKTPETQEVDMNYVVRSRQYEMVESLKTVRNTERLFLD